METVEVRIEKLVFGGEGLGHAGDSTIFVPYVLPGELVAVEPAERKKKFVRGRLHEVLASSPQRCLPPCSHFGVCGGCHYQHMPYETQVQYKTEILRETLRRIGHIEWEPAIKAHPSPPFEYRNRAQWKIRPATGKSEEAIGYLQAGSSEIVPVRECPILAPGLAAILKGLQALIEKDSLPRGTREVEAFIDSSGQKALLNVSFDSLATSPAAVAHALRDALSNVQSILTHDAARDRYALVGPGFISYPTASGVFRVGHLSFFQVNRFLIDELVQATAGEESGGLAFDLYAGAGLFTLELARRFDRVVAVDANPAAVRDLSCNLKTNGVAAEHINAEADAFLAGARETPDLVLVDPPRTGLSPKIVSRLLATLPARITYLSCDPATLARDLAALTQTPDGRPGYRIRELHLFDMFPETYHIETLARLERRA